MNTKDNQRARLTRMLMKQAYLELMHQTAPGKITVKDICAAAQLNRSTFYLHYNEPNDILIELEDEAIAQVSEALMDISAFEDGAPDAMEYLLGFLRYIQKNDDLFRTFLVENPDPHFRRKLQDCTREIIEQWFAVDLKKEFKEGAYLYLVSGSMELLAEWIRSNYRMSEKDMGLILFGMCEGGLRGLLEKL